jgi:transposase
MIQITPQMRVVVAVEPADFRKGIDGLARLCQEALGHDPFGGWVFVFRNRRATALKVLVYDGQGFWLCHKRLSRGRFPWWPTSKTAAAKTLGGAIAYMLKHWERLTLFLRVPGAPLGRVEVWRGGLGFGLLPCQGFPVRGAISACHAPFPHPAHRTGRAAFPHPALLQNFRTSLSARPRGFGAVGTAPASRKGGRRGTVCTPCRDAVPAASAICGHVAPCTCGSVDRPGLPALG